MGREVLKPAKVLREDLEVRKQTFEGKGWFFTHYENNDSWSALSPEENGELLEAQRLGELLDKIDEHESGIQIVEVSEPNALAENADPEPASFEVEPERLDEGGDIKSSYSADLIADKGRIRKPFEFEGKFFVNIGMIGNGKTGITSASAYEIVKELDFDGTPISYEESFKNNLGGSYHGVRVEWNGFLYVMREPEITFQPQAVDPAGEMSEAPGGQKAGDNPEEIETASPAEDNAQLIEETEPIDGGAVEASGDDEEIVYEDKLPATTIESCKILLSNDEILQRNQDFLKRMTDKDDEVARFASLKDTHKANLKFIELDVERLRQILNSGQEWRDIECALEYDFNKGEVTIRRQDTYEVVKRRVMTRDELQKHLFATRGKRKFSGHQEF